MPRIFSLIFIVLSFPLFGAILLEHSSRPLEAEADLSSLVPWETPVDGLFVRSHHDLPVIDLDRFELVIDGLVEKPLHFTLKELEKYPQHSEHAVVECAGNWRGYSNPRAPGVQWGKGAAGNIEWTGVHLLDLLNDAHVKKEAKFARIEGMDRPALSTVPGFIRSVPVEKLMNPSTLVALKMNRETMPLLHGGPLRLILPGWYAENWIKWLTHITLTASEDPGFYMAKGYRMPTGETITELRVQSIITQPREGSTVAKAPFAVRGKAFSGAGGISKVEVSIDGGKKWSLAKVETQNPSGGWQEFEVSVKPVRFGRLTVMSRATDAKGNVQPIKAVANPGGYVRNAVDEISVEVAKESVPDALKLAEEKCLTCHTLEMVLSQRIPKPLWEKTITKMQGFGAKIDEAEKATLVRFLSAREKLPPMAPALTNYGFQSQIFQADYPEGKAMHGAKLYTKNCAACHGQVGEGGIGSRLKGRYEPAGIFWDVVISGKGSMPSFRDLLSDEDVRDLYAFVKSPE